jgi:hypothetical protein
MTVRDDVRYVRPSQPRFPVAVHGGNWKGQPYIAYREHDRIIQLMSRSMFMTRKESTDAMLSERKAQP